MRLPCPWFLLRRVSPEQTRQGTPTHRCNAEDAELVVPGVLAEGHTRRQMRALRGSADALGQRDDDPFRPPDVGHPPNALVLADATDQSVASVAAQSTAACRSLTSKATLRNPSSLAMAAGEPGTESGRTKLESSRRVPSSGGFSMTISVRESGMPQTVSKNSPSTNVLPSTSRPSATKKAVTTSRSATVRPTWSKRRTCDIGPSSRRRIDPCIRHGRRSQYLSLRDLRKRTLSAACQDVQLVCRTHKPDPRSVEPQFAESGSSAVAWWATVIPACFSARSSAKSATSSHPSIAGSRFAVRIEQHGFI